MLDRTGRPARRHRPRRSTRVLTAALALCLTTAAVAACSGDDGLSTGDPDAASTPVADADTAATGAVGDDDGTNGGTDGGGELPEPPIPGQVRPTSSAEAAALRDSDRRAVIIDVRPLAEYLDGHVVGAQHIPLADEELWERRTSALDPGRPVLVYCNTGVLAAEAAQRLVDQGFGEVYDLGGMSDWAEGDLPLDR